METKGVRRIPKSAKGFGEKFEFKAFVACLIQGSVDLNLSREKVQNYPDENRNEASEDVRKPSLHCWVTTIHLAIKAGPLSRQRYESALVHVYE